MAARSSSMISRRPSHVAYSCIAHAIAIARRQGLLFEDARLYSPCLRDELVVCLAAWAIGQHGMRALHSFELLHRRLSGHVVRLLVRVCVRAQHKSQEPIQRHRTMLCNKGAVPQADSTRHHPAAAKLLHAVATVQRRTTASTVRACANGAHRCFADRHVSGISVTNTPPHCTHPPPPTRATRAAALGGGRGGALASTWRVRYLRASLRYAFLSSASVAV